MNDDYTIRMRYLALYFWEKETVWIPCGQCPVGQLKLENVKHFEDRATRESYSSEDFDPEWITGIFNGELKCSNCEETTVFNGLYRVDMTFGSDGRPAGYGDQLMIKNLLPSVPLIRFPRRCPKPIKDWLSDASSVIWSNPDLAANRIRTAIDGLLTLQNVNKTTINRQGKRVRLDTHSRIMLYAKSNSAVAKALEAVKWIGNNGSHEAGLSIGDVFDGLDLFSYSLNILYGDDSKAMQHLASKIIARKGMVKTKK